MSSLSSFFKHNKKVIGLAFMVLAVVILLWILLSKAKPAPTGDDVADGGVENLTAHFVTSYYTAGQPTLKSDAAAILVSFTAPTKLGTNATKLGGVLVNLVEKGSGKDIPHPTVDELIAQPILPLPFISMMPEAGVVYKDVAIPLAGAKTKLTLGKTYRLGISMMNDIKSSLGNEKIPNLYGDFTYIDIVYFEQEGPGTVSGFSSSLGF